MLSFTVYCAVTMCQMLSIVLICNIVIDPMSRAIALSLPVTQDRGTTLGSFPFLRMEEPGEVERISYLSTSIPDQVGGGSGISPGLPNPRPFFSSARCTTLPPSGPTLILITPRLLPSLRPASKAALLPRLTHRSPRPPPPCPPALASASSQFLRVSPLFLPSHHLTCPQSPPPGF